MYFLSSFCLFHHVSFATNGCKIRLKDVKDVDRVDPNGTTIKGRMQEISKATEADIVACSNACDVYSKKKLICE